MSEVPVLRIRRNPEALHGYDVNLVIGGVDVAARSREVRLTGTAEERGWRAEMIFSLGAFDVDAEIEVDYDNLTMTLPNGVQYRLMPVQKKGNDSGE